MELKDLLIDLFGRVSEQVHDVTSDIDEEELLTSPEPGSNPIGWLIWHLTRVQDMHISEILETEQLWVDQDWGPRFGLASEPYNIGYGHTVEQIGTVKPDSAAALFEYFTAVEARTRPLLESTTPSDLDRIVDRRWDPPVNLGTRLVSIADDSIQHAGQAAYVKGLLRRRRSQGGDSAPGG
ncbi:MAG: hypothetical protein JJLCMIEE_03552 [Acidimicrobiales bacterium]|nr:MAG: DUF664 domain-containing protein [Actinomycetota bacterium]MBV6510412.1 hypothetical protein [Acidimicrobiales bacterium]RIK02539.1 MAG: hypothetical protein DCC48_18060 [Acidobacteriota bacterium]